MQRLAIGQVTGELKKQIENEVIHIFGNAPAPEKEMSKPAKTYQEKPKET